MKNMSLSERIKERRKKLHYTQKLLAEKVKVSPQVISNWERGYTEPGADDIVHLSKALECSGDYLLGRTDSPETDLSNQTADQEDLALKLEEMKELLKDNKHALIFGGEPLSDEAKESLLESIEYAFRVTERMNRK